MRKIAKRKGRRAIASVIEKMEERTLFNAFTPGDLVVYTVGNGSATLANTGNPVSLTEYSPSGSFVQTISLPTYASGTATSEGGLSLSPDGHTLAVPGYVNTSSSGSLPSSTTVNRMVDLVNAAGTVDSSTVIPAADFGGNNIRSAATDGVNVWVGTANDGVRETPVDSTATSTQLDTAPTNTRDVEIYNGQLYAGSGSSPYYGVNTVGTGLPTSSGQTVTNTVPDASHSPYAFYFASPTSLYVADSSVGIQKYYYNGSSWALEGTISVPTTLSGAAGLTGSVSGSTVTLYATDGGSGATGGGDIWAITDVNAANQTFSNTTLPAAIVTAGTDLAFRNIAFVPTAANTAPSVNSPTSAAITTNSATLGATIASNGGATITASGVVYSLTSANANPQIGGTGVTNVLTSPTATSGAFSVPVTGLSSSSSYSFEAYATNSVGTTYTPVATFTTATPSATAPTVTSPTATNITSSTATLGGDITSNGGAPTTTYGVVYSATSTNANPQIGGTGVTNVSTSGAFTGVFTEAASSLEPSTGYSYDAYATNSVGTTYSPVATFTSAPIPTQTLAQAEAAPGSFVTIDNAVVSEILNTNYQYLINDGTGSVRLYGSISGYTPTLGDKIDISGTLTSYQGAWEFDTNANSTESTVSQGNTVPPAFATTVSNINQTPLASNVNNYLLSVDNATLSFPGYTTFPAANITGTITDSSGTMTAYYYYSDYSTGMASLVGQTIPTGLVKVTGVADDYGPPEFNPLSISTATNSLPVDTYTTTGGTDIDEGNGGAADQFDVSNENGTGTPGNPQNPVSATLTVTRSASDSNANLPAETVTWTTANGTGVAGTDFGTYGSTTQPTGTLTFAAGSTTATSNIVIPLLQEATPAGDHTFTVSFGPFNPTESGTRIESAGSYAVSIVDSTPVDTTIAGAKALGVTGQYTPVSIQNVTVDAILSEPNTSYPYYSFTVHDSTGAADMFGVLPNNETPVVGDTYTVTGLWDPYHNIPEIGASGTRIGISTFTETGTSPVLNPITTTTITDATLSTTSPTITVSSTSGMGQGQSVSGPGIAPGTTVVSVTSPTQVLLSADPTANITNGTGPYVFSETISNFNTPPANLNTTFQPGQLITLNNVTISGAPGSFGSANFSATLTDSTGSVTLYYWPSSYSEAYDFFNGLTVPTGPISLTGFVSVYPGTGTGSQDVEFTPISEVGTPDSFSVATGLASDGQADKFQTVNRGTPITVTINRSESADSAQVVYNLTDDSATHGVDYTDTDVAMGLNMASATATGYTGTVNFAVGQTSATVTVTTAANPGHTGDAIFSISLSNPTGATGYLPFTGAPTSVIIQDPTTDAGVSQSAYTENATVLPSGVSTSATAKTLITIAGTSAVVGSGPGNAFGVFDYNDQSNDPSHLYGPGGDSTPESPLVSNINSVELETVGTPESFNASGMLDVYVVTDTGTLPANLEDDLATSPDVINGQLGTEDLLGIISYNANQSALGYTPFNLTSLNPAGLTLLETALNNGTKFRIAVTADSSAEATTATWVGTNPAFNYISPIIRINYTAVPAWLAPGSQATWNGTTLNVTGPSTIIADPAVYGNEPLIVASGAAAQLAITPTVPNQDIHVGGITLTGGAGLTMTSVAGRSHSNHNVLVLGTRAVSASNPTFSIDSASKLDMADNDLIIHTGETAALGASELSTVQSLAYGPNGGRHNGKWTGNELTSSTAAARRAADFRETTQLGVVLNNDLAARYSSWVVGSASEAVNRYDIIVKYTYTGDFNLDGQVNAADSSVLGLHYNSGATSGNEWAFGDTNDDGLLNTTDISTFGVDFGDGTASAGLTADQVQL